MRAANIGARSDPPFQETLKLVDPEKYYFELKPGPTERSYETVDSLLRDGGVSLARRMEQARSKWSLSGRDAALFMVGTYAWSVGGPAIACYVLSRRVPDVSPENVALTFDGDGGLSEVSLRSERFAVLPSDPAADHPKALVLDDEAAMLVWMREKLVAGVEPLIGAVRNRARLSRRAAWRGVTDYVSSAFLMVARDTKDQARYAADAEAFVTDPGSPLRGSTRFFIVENRDHRGAYLTRGACCQAYKKPGYDNCDSCPMLTQEEREQRALVDLATRG